MVGSCRVQGNNSHSPIIIYRKNLLDGVGPLSSNDFFFFQFKLFPPLVPLYIFIMTDLPMVDDITVEEEVRLLRANTISSASRKVYLSATTQFLLWLLTTILLYCTQISSTESKMTVLPKLSINTCKVLQRIPQFSLKILK